MDRDQYGRFKSHEWSYFTDWPDANKPWRPFIPIPVSATVDDWIFQFFLTAEEYTDPTNDSMDCEIHLRPSFLAKLSESTIELTEMGHTVHTAYGSSFDPPEIVQINWAEKEFYDPSTVLSQIWDVRRSALDLVRYIVYFLLKDPRGWDIRFPQGSRVYRFITQKKCMESPKRGIFLSAQDLQESLVFLLLEHDIPEVSL